MRNVQNKYALEVLWMSEGKRNIVIAILYDSWRSFLKSKNTKICFADILRLGDQFSNFLYIAGDNALKISSLSNRRKGYLLKTWSLNRMGKGFSFHVDRFVREMISLLLQLTVSENNALERQYPAFICTVLGIPQQFSTVSLKSKLREITPRGTVH